MSPAPPGGAVSPGGAVGWDAPPPAAVPAVRPRPALPLLAAALALAAPAGAQVAERLDDLRLATAVRIALVDDARTRPLDVVVTARGGAVRVEGAGPEGAVVAEVARRVPGVRSVGGVGDGPAPVPVAVERRPAPPAERQDGPGDDGHGGGDLGGAVVHTVRPGDTLFSLARRFDTTVDAVLQLNGLRSPSIRVGQRLRVR